MMMKGDDQELAFCLSQAYTVFYPSDQQCLRPSSVVSQEDGNIQIFPSLSMNQQQPVTSAPEPTPSLHSDGGSQQAPNSNQSETDQQAYNQQTVPSVLIMVVDNSEDEAAASVSVVAATAAPGSSDPAPQPNHPPVTSTGAVTLADISSDAAFVTKRAAVCYYGHHNIVLNAPVTFNISFGGSNPSVTAPINILGLKSDCSVNNISSSGAYAVMSGSKPTAFAPNNSGN